jgi:LacI family gluconate utilization system Gnt-I transcriptional repressor
VDGARIGALSAQALLDRLNGDESAERIVNTGFELIQRGST